MNILLILSEKPQTRGYGIGGYLKSESNDLNGSWYVTSTKIKQYYVDFRNGLILKRALSHFGRAHTSSDFHVFGIQDVSEGIANHRIVVLL